MFLFPTKEEGTFDNPGLPPGVGVVLISASTVPHWGAKSMKTLTDNRNNLCSLNHLKQRILHQSCEFAPFVENCSDNVFEDRTAHSWYLGIGSRLQHLYHFSTNDRWAAQTNQNIWQCRFLPFVSGWLGVKQQLSIYLSICELVCNSMLIHATRAI